MSTLITDQRTDTGRDLNAAELKRQIGFATVLSISGGNAVRVGPSVVDFPDSRTGYSVRVRLEADDTYTVQRVFRRSGKEFLHGERTDVYFDEVGEVCYYASCFVSYDADEWVTKA